MNDSTMKNGQNDNEVSTFNYLVVLAKYSRMIIFTSCAVTVLTYLILVSLPNKYTAKASLLSPQQNMTMSAQILDNLLGGGAGTAVSGVTSRGNGLGGMAAGLLGLNRAGELYVGMLKSNTILDSIIDRFNLKKLYGVKYIEEARRKLSRTIKIGMGKDGIIVIEVTNKDPKLAAAIANAFISDLDKFLQAMAVREAEERLVFLEKELTKTNIKLAKAEEALRQYSEKSGVIQIDAQARGMIEYIANLRASIDAKEVQIKVLKNQATPVNYDVIRLETEIAGLKEKLKAAESQEQTCVGDVCISTSKMPSAGLEYLRLFREVHVQELLFKLYTKLVEVARLDIVRDAAVTQTVDIAKVPEVRSNTRMIPSILVGMGTFIIMVFVAFGREYLERAKENEKSAQELALIAFYLRPYTNFLQRIKNWFRFRRGP